ncbi:MAG: two-component regulator propeller domain-containing protein [Bacteroidota bacterium]
MKRKINLIYLLLIPVLNISCAENKSKVKEVNQSEFSTISTTDTLKFVSGIRTIYQDSKGDYWFGSHNEGVSHYDGNSFEYLTINNGLADNKIHSIQEDENGNIWFDSERQITKFDGRICSVFEKSKIAETNLKEKEISLSDNDLWFRYKNDFGVYRFDGKQLSFIEMEKPSPNKINGRLGFGVTGVSKLINGKIWFGTSYAGIFGFDGKSFEKISNETLGLDIKVEFLHIRSTLSDSKGKLWIGNNGIGVLLKVGDSIVNFSKEQGKLLDTNELDLTANNLKSLQAVFAIEEDENGNIWFGDRDSGAWKYDGEKLINYHSIYNPQMKEEIILDIYNDKKGKLWFILSSGTVFTFNGKSFDKFQGFSK